MRVFSSCKTVKFAGRRSTTLRTPIFTASDLSAATGIRHGAEGISWVAGSTYGWRNRSVLKHQLLISSRSRRRTTNLTTLDRLVLGLSTLCVSRRRIAKLGAFVKPATLLKFHKALVDRKYRRLFSSRHRRRKPGPKGPPAALVAAIVEVKRRNPRFGCVRIAQQIAHAFGIELDKDAVRRVLARHYRQATPEPTDPVG